MKTWTTSIFHDWQYEMNLWCPLPNDLAGCRNTHQKRNPLPVVCGLSGIHVIAPSLYLYVAAFPADKDYD